MSGKTVMKSGWHGVKAISAGLLASLLLLILVIVLYGIAVVFVFTYFWSPEEYNKLKEKKWIL